MRKIEQSENKNGHLFDKFISCPVVPITVMEVIIRVKIARRTCTRMQRDIYAYVTIVYIPQ